LSSDAFGRSRAGCCRGLFAGRGKPSW
jgi:hypothetical protein